MVVIFALIAVVSTVSDKKAVREELCPNAKKYTSRKG
jgi:hypothetical protein